MIILKSTNERIVAQVITAQSTAPVSINTSWRSTTDISHKPDSSEFNVVDSTPVNIVPIPASANEQHVIDYISIYNQDSVSRLINVGKVVTPGPITYFIKSVLLAPGESAEYNDKEGWKVFASNGALKQVYQNGASPIGTNVQMVVLSANVVNNNVSANTMQDVTGLQFAVVAGQRYRFKFVINYSAQAATTGSRWSISGPGSPSDLNYDSDYSLTAATRTVNTGQSAYDLPAASNVSSPSTVSNIAIIEGFITPSANGVVIGRFASEISASAITAKAGSYVEYQQL